jgi:hypothetical protein
VAQEARLLLGQDDRPAGSISEALEHSASLARAQTSKVRP